MATLILTSVGGAIGGPIGAAVGAVLGGAVDRAVLKPRGRQGPRLTELAVQTSSYGSPIPQLFGTLRVAGTVVWATDLKESRSRSGGGKGRPATTSYSYSISCAVLLSARPIVGIARIWADGRLLRGAAGDWKSATGFRVHTGGEDQPADPLIVAAEGRAFAPALRGQAYAVFEDLQLADYGNRLPSLTFEVIADPAPVPTGTIAAALGVSAEAGGRTLDGFSAYGDSRRGVLETLAAIDGAWFAETDGAITMMSGPGMSGPGMSGPGVPVPIADDGFAAPGDREPARGRSIAAAAGAPRALTVLHYDPARDYQAGLQRAGGGAGTREERVELPAALTADTAKAVAAEILARAHARRERRVVTLPAATGLAVAPGQRVTIAGEAPGAYWRIARWAFARMTVRLTLEPINRSSRSVPAASGRISSAIDLPHGPTYVHAFELPPREAAAAPQLTIAAGGGAGWRSAALLLSLDGGDRWTELGPTAAPAVIGEVTVPPGAAGSCLRDDRSVLEIRLVDPAQTLSDADDAALDAGENLALIGDEVLQFGRAQAVGGGRWRLTRLLRGRRGTEWAADRHRIAERFVLLEGERLRVVPLPPEALGRRALVLAAGLGDVAGPATAEAALDGASVRPPAPVGLTWSQPAPGVALVRWTRRSRSGWDWRDGGATPLGEERESYRVAIDGRERVTSTPDIVVARSDRPIAITIAQLGTLAASPPVHLTIPAR